MTTSKRRSKAASRSNPFAELDELIGKLHPRHKETRRPAVLSDDFPKRARLLWEAIGASDATAVAGAVPLSLEKSRTALERIFAAWYALPRARTRWKAGDGPEGFWKALPAKVRLVCEDEGSIVLTDETKGAADPPVLVMVQDSPPVRIWHARYSEWLIWELVTILARSRSAEHNALAKVAAKRVLKAVYRPPMFQLAEHVWWMKMPAFTRDDSVPENVQPLFYRSIEDYFDYLLALPDKQLPFFNPPASPYFLVQKAGPLDLFSGTPAGFRVFEPVDFDGRPSKYRVAVGRPRGISLWMDMAPRGDLTVRFNPKHKTKARAWLKAQKVKITGEWALRPGYDSMGW